MARPKRFELLTPKFVVSIRGFSTARQATLPYSCPLHKLLNDRGISCYGVLQRGLTWIILISNFPRLNPD